ncbi:MAG: hypothetical protein JXB50_15115 [Spirochaetes bacterium]|nr:hypothetical protein [Spirochaetota bacterium]
MLKKIYIPLFFVFLINCVSGDRIKKETNDKNNLIEKDTYLTLIDFSYYTESENKNDIKNITYNLIIKLKRNDNLNQLNYTISDENDKILLNKKNIKPKIDSNNSLLINDFFISKLSYNKLKYNIKTTINNEIKEINGEILNKEFPFIENITIGPVISQYIENKLNVSLNINIDISNCKNLKWIRFIPPAHDFFWDIPWLIEGDFIKANAVIYEKNKNFLYNGNYILQINFDSYGVYQKNIKMIDYLNNFNGVNYGIPIPFIIYDEKEYLKLNIFDIKSIDFIEIWLYLKDNGEYQKLGYAIINPDTLINKKELKELFVDNENKKLKIKNNFTYFARLHINSKELNNLKYLSISDYFQIKFHGFTIPFLN